MRHWTDLLCYLSLGIIGLGIVGNARADDAAARPAKSAKSNKSTEPPAGRLKVFKPRPQGLPYQPQKLKAVKGAEAPPAKESATPRFQMLPAGKRVVILDTHTGKTRIIDPEAGVQQSVEIGKSWITVTVVVNAAGNQQTAHSGK